MARVLIKAIDHTHPDPDKDQRGAYKRGMPVVVFEDGHVWGAKEGPPAFYQLDIIGATRAQIETYIKGWERTISFNVTNSDGPTDVHTVEVSAGNVSAGGLGNLTQAQVENFLANWGATLGTISANNVEFTAGIYNAIISDGFWRRNVSGVIFNEVDYTQGTGVHRVSADYTAPGWPAATVAQTVTDRGGTVVTNVANVITFDMARLVVRQAFFDEVTERLDNTISRRRFQLNSTEMDALEAAGGIAVSRTLVQVQAALRDRTTE